MSDTETNSRKMIGKSVTLKQTLPLNLRLSSFLRSSQIFLDQHEDASIAHDKENSKNV